MKTKIFIIILFLYAAFFRVSLVNHPFWVDEFSSAIQARLLNTYGILGYFLQTDYYAEPNNILSHLLIAFSFNFFGEHEWSARLPFMIIGSVVPLAVFLLGKTLFNTRTGVVAALLSTTSYFMITWPRQARGYPLQQLLLLLLLLFYTKYRFTHERKFFVLLILTGFLGILTHYFFTLFVIIIGIFLALHHKSDIKKQLIPIVGVSVAVVITIFLTGILQNAVQTLINIFKQSPPNNLWYYHALLWREETVIIFLAVLGVIFSFFKQVRYVWTFYWLIGLQLVVLFFFLPAYTSRYLLPIFPLLILFASYCINQLSEWAAQEYNLKPLTSLIAIFITLFIIGNGKMFTIKPQPFYSVNHVMRDIALVDYNRVYAKIATAQKKYPDLAVIETWIDRSRWYLGQDFENVYWFRWLNAEGTINGITLTTNAVKNENGIYEVQLSGPRKVPLISSQTDLERVLAQHQQGFIWIDDTSMSADVISYAQNNFTKVIQVDHYPFDDNPYSIWPGTLYSWGIEAPDAEQTQP